MELAKEIRSELKKELGLNSRNVSVRCPHYGCIRVEVKNKDTQKHYEAIKAIAKKYEKVDRCESTGEILSGGNTYIFVDKYR